MLYGSENGQVFTFDGASGQSSRVVGQLPTKTSSVLITDEKLIATSKDGMLLCASRDQTFGQKSQFS